MIIVLASLYIAVLPCACMIAYKIGEKSVWNYVSENYIAIHKKCVIGPILLKQKEIKKEKKTYEKNKSKRVNKKTSK